MKAEIWLNVCLVVALTAVALTASCRSDTGQDTALHPADVPVNPLVHSSKDPTTEYPESFALQVAVFRSKDDEGMLGLIHALHEMGIPFFVTRDLDQALRHPLVIVYPSADGRTFTGEQVRKLGLHVSNGGSLLSFNVLAGALKPIFGFRDSVASRRS